jgi:hypothetical protein
MPRGPAAAEDGCVSQAGIYPLAASDDFVAFYFFLSRR